MAADDAIIPDTKDWTWVLQRACPECGFDPGAIDVAQVPELMAVNAAAWRDVLARPASPGARAPTSGRRSSTHVMSVTCSSCSTSAST